MKAKIIISLLYSIALGSVGFAAPAANDDFVNATVLNGNSDREFGTTIDSTAEAGEPSINTGPSRGGGVWYRWRAPNQSGRLTVSLEVFDPRYYSAPQTMDVFTGNNVNSIYDISSFLGYLNVPGGEVRTGQFFVFANQEYYIRVSDRQPYAASSAVEVSVHFSPIYRTNVRFLGSSRLGRRGTVRAKVTDPSNASSIRVSGSGGRASRVRYSKGSGKVTFRHLRKGKVKRGGKKKVSYTISCFKAGQRSGSSRRSFRSN